MIDAPGLRRIPYTGAGAGHIGQIKPLTLQTYISFQDAHLGRTGTELSASPH